jgi:hypothetical protein
MQHMQRRLQLSRQLRKLHLLLKVAIVRLQQRPLQGKRRKGLLVRQQQGQVLEQGWPVVAALLQGVQGMGCRHKRCRGFGEHRRHCVQGWWLYGGEGVMWMCDCCTWVEGSYTHLCIWCDVAAWWRLVVMVLFHMWQSMVVVVVVAVVLMMCDIVCCIYMCTAIKHR